MKIYTNEQTQKEIIPLGEVPALCPLDTLVVLGKLRKEILTKIAVRKTCTLPLVINYPKQGERCLASLHQEGASTLLPPQEGRKVFLPSKQETQKLSR